MNAGFARLLLVALSGAIGAAGQRFSFRVYSADEGLENRTINAILQDREGYLWVGTQAGAFRYDGTRFRSFQRADGLPGDNVHGLRETTDGTLWVYTDAGPAFRVGDRFEPFRSTVPLTVQPPFGSGLMDPGPGGELYMATREGLLVLHRQSPVSWTARRVPGTHGLVPGVHVAADRTVWFGCGDGICRLTPGGIESYGPAQGVPPGAWAGFGTDPSGQVWARAVVGQHPDPSPGGEPFCGFRTEPARRPGPGNRTRGFGLFSLRHRPVLPHRRRVEETGAQGRSAFRCRIGWLHGSRGIFLGGRIRRRPVALGRVRAVGRVDRVGGAAQ